MSEDATIAARPAPTQPGDLAPEFTLPALERDGSVSLADYRGRSPLFLALFIGLWCPSADGRSHRWARPRASSRRSASRRLALWPAGPRTPGSTSRTARPGWRG